MPFGLSLILHPANFFKKGEVPIVKQMLPVMVRSVCAKYTVEHLRHFKRKTIAKHWGTSKRHTRVDTDGCCTQAMDVSQKRICPEKTVALQWRYKSVCH